MHSIERFKLVNNRKQSGISMIEVLIAMLVLTIGLLGMAALQAQATKFNHSAYLRTQATNLAYDIGDRIRANQDQALSGNYDHDLEDSKPSGNNISDQDLAQWLTAIENALPSGRGAIIRNGSTITIQVQWDDTRGNETEQIFVTRMTL